MGLVDRLIGNGKAASRRDEAGGLSLTDGALDTLGSVLRTFGDRAFPVGDGVDPASFRTLCAALACHVENGAPVPAIGIAQSDNGERRWGHVRRFVIDRRHAESDYVVNRIADYRGIVDELVGGLRAIEQRDEVTEICVNRSLQKIEAAVETGVVDEIRATLNQTIRNIADSFARQKQEYERHIGDLNKRMGGLQEDLTSAREEMKRDALTSTYNRGGFDTAILHSLNLNFILHQPVTVVLLDLDDFKSINDTYGHAAGDEILRAIGECLVRTFIRKSDVVARYGGDEFAVILPDTTAGNCKGLLDRFFAALRDIPVPGADGSVHVNCSGGYTEIQSGDTVESLVRRVDAALYGAKKAGRGCYRYVGPPDADERLASLGTN